MIDPLVTLFGGKTKARILETLLLNGGQSYHLRGLAQAAGTDSGNTSKLLAQLVDAGLVFASPDSPSTRYSIDPKSPLAAPLRELVASANSLAMDLRQAASSIDASYVGVFGSVAAGTQDAQSDVDVLVVGNVSAVTAQLAFKAVGRKHRRAINAIVVTVPQLVQKVRDGGAFWTSVATSKRIDLKGSWTNAANGETTAGRRISVRSLPA